MHFFYAPVSLLSKRFTLSAAAIHFLVVFQNRNATAGSRSPSKFKVRFMSAQYVKMIIRYVKMSVLCIKSSIRYVPSQVRVLTMSAQYAKSSLRACLILSLRYATRLPCPFSTADNHLLLSNAWFSLLCTAKTLHFTVVFTGFRDFDLF